MSKLELIVSVAIIGVLMLIFSPAMKRIPREDYQGKDQFYWHGKVTNGDPATRAQAVAALRELLRKSNNSSVRWGILNRLEDMGPESAELLPLLQDLLQDDGVHASHHARIRETIKRVAPADPITPTAPLQLFNGKDLTGFYTWLGSPAKGQPALGKNNDPDKVFTVHDGMIHVSGKVFGGFITEKEYANYHLVAEFKWGEKTHPPREGKARDSGILLHCVGEDGAAGGVWMESIECQIIEGGTGDFILVGGKGKPSLTVPCEERGGQLYYAKDGNPTTRNSGRFNWFARDPAWKDVAGFRGEHEVEKPAGEWNRLECICAGDKITNILNGTTVNAGSNASYTRGKILFQSEGAEIFFRKIELRPLQRAN